MGGVYISEGKNGGSIVRGRKKWGECTLEAEGRGIMSTPPLRVFLAPSLNAVFPNALCPELLRKLAILLILPSKRG